MDIIFVYMFVSACICIGCPFVQLVACFCKRLVPCFSSQLRHIISFHYYYYYYSASCVTVFFKRHTAVVIDMNVNSIDSITEKQIQKGKEEKEL